MIVKLSKIQEKGQVTIPIEFRREWGLKKGDQVVFTKTVQGILIRPQKNVAEESLNRIGEELKERGISIEELIEDGREFRGQLLADEK
jgi:AbrB family looped-hinge helix DNA binding protein